jgi:hypothetical protein
VLNDAGLLIGHEARGLRVSDLPNGMRFQMKKLV